MGLKSRLRKERQRQSLIALSIILALLLGGYAISMLYDERKKMQVVFETANGKSEFVLEVADTPAKQAKGLMYRKALAKNGGMIFIKQTDQVERFWMRNTFVSLDMLFVDAEKKVVGILESVPILNDEPREIGKPSRYVIELLAGTAKREGITIGTKVSFN
jgi:uncharacterized protein